MKPRKTHTKLRSIANTPGVYALYDSLGVIVYIGKSKNLGSRIKISASDREHAHSFSYMQIDNLSDMSVMEVYLICKHQPMYNVDMKHRVATTFDLHHHYEFSDRYEFVNEVGIEDALQYFDQDLAAMVADDITLGDLDAKFFIEVDGKIYCQYRDLLFYGMSKYVEEFATKHGYTDEDK